MTNWQDAIATVRPFMGSIIFLGLGMLLYAVLSKALGRLHHSKWLTVRMEARLRFVLRAIFTLSLTLGVLQQAGLFDNAWALLSTIIAAIALGFIATWSVLSNGVCALLILLYQPFEVGDEIELLDSPKEPKGLRGRAHDLNLMYTTVIQSGEEQAALKIPNNLFFQKILRNHSLG